MGVFGAVFGCRGDAGFNGCCSGARSGVVGFKVATLSLLLREKVRPAWPDVCVSAKKVALRAHNGSKLAFLRLLGEFFRGNAAEGAVLGDFFALIGPAPRSCRRRGARGLLRWGFCSIRSWLAACRRRVVPLMTPFPPFGDGPAEPSAASARSTCGSRDNWTLGQRRLYSSVHADYCFAPRRHEPARPGHGRPDAFPDPDVPA